MRPVTTALLKTLPALILLGVADGCWATETVSQQTGGLALPVFPEAEGFGSTTRAGRGGRVYRVTHLAAANEPGSLAACLEARDQPGCAGRECARVCIFETSGTIVLDQDLWVHKPYLTVAGQSAPSPGITLRGAPLRISTNDVLVQHLRIRVGDDPPRSGSPWPATRDGLGILSIPKHGNPDVHSVVIDHVSVSWAVDENMEVYGSSVHDVTISNSINSEALARSIHRKTVDSNEDGVADHRGRPHSMGLLVSYAPENVAVIGNLLAHNNARNPQLGGGSTLIANNVVYGWGSQAGLVKTGGKAFGPTLASIASNVYVASPSSVLLRGAFKAPIALSCSLKEGSAIYVSDDNLLIPGRLRRPPRFYRDNKCDFKLCRDTAGCPIVVKTPPVPLDGVTLRRAADVERSVLAQAGARPADRDAVDLRIVQEVRQRSCHLIARGRSRCIIDSPRDVGGWPRLAQNRVSHRLPDDPAGDADGDGYTNLEEWLHALARQVEGR